MKLEQAIRAEYTRRRDERVAQAAGTRKPGDPHPASLHAGVEATLRRRPDVVWPVPGEAAEFSRAAH